MVGECHAPKWLETRWILSKFDDTEADAVARYTRFVADGNGQPSPWEHLRHQAVLGDGTFVESMLAKVPVEREVPQAKARPLAKPLADYTSRHPDRDRAIAVIYESGGYTLWDIEGFFGLHYSRVSKIVQAGEEG